jgi:membrane-associated phospholipid phosphatase
MDPILYWNDVLLEANKTSHTDLKDGTSNGPTRSSRAFAITHLAMYDAYFGIMKNATKQYLTARPLFGGTSSPESASAAVAAAAHATLSELYPSQKAFLDRKHLGAGLSSKQDKFAHEFGIKIARAILELRKDDPMADDNGYAAGVARGEHRQDPDNPGQGFHGPRYGSSLAFAVTSLHGLNAPYALDAPEYRDGLRRVRGKGIKPELAGTLPPQSPYRTSDETLAGIYWGYDGTPNLGTPPRLYNQIVRTVAIARGFNVEQNAELFAKVNAAMGDAGIFAWRDKYRYNLWRPVLGVREDAVANGPTGTPANSIDAQTDTEWLPLGGPLSNGAGKNFTPPFPAYPSGHATFGAAALHTLRRFCGTKKGDFGPDKWFEGLSFVSDEYNGITANNLGTVRPRHERSFKDGLWGMIVENGLSREYLGVHWYFDAFALGKDGKPDLSVNIGGVRLGLDIADDIFDKGPKQSSVRG